MRRFSFYWFLWLLLAVAARGELAQDLAQIHAEAIGGRDRLQQWKGLRASGRVITAGQELEFELIAARPNRVRVVVRSGGRALLQATDGAVAWQQDLGSGEPPRLMAPADARDFIADAEFDDALVNWRERGYALDYAGEAQWDGGRVFKLLVTRPGEAPSFLLLDATTFFIVARLAAAADHLVGGSAQETRYDDFRPVGGIILPHRIRVYAGSRLLRETVLGHVLPVAEPAPEVFAMPIGAVSTAP
ncbi:MAG TPA: hypothetical protein VEQ65_12300 [Opitutus sp.]|nr:hypothetical protein [Opitutus sp.]